MCELYPIFFGVFFGIFATLQSPKKLHKIYNVFNFPLFIDVITKRIIKTTYNVWNGKDHVCQKEAMFTPSVFGIFIVDIGRGIADRSTPAESKK